jgi:subtilisin family serine protease
MKPSRLLVPVALAGAMVLGACVDTTPTAIDAPSRAAPARSAAATGGEISQKYVLLFQKRAPADLASQVARLGGTVLLNHQIGIAVVTGLDPAQLSTLKEAVHAEFAEQQADYKLLEPAGVRQPVEAKVTPVAARLALSPTSSEDPTTALLYAAQWNMRQIHADEAWAAGELGDENVTVAILDTGIDYLLPDLVGRVDLSRSKSFEPLDDLLTARYFPGRDPSTDLHFHGTNVATQVASNAWAFAGVTSKATLMSVKVCSVAGGCHGVIEGFLYAIDNGADVINMSLGGWFAKKDYPGEVALFNRLMNYAKQQGVTVVVAAGNDAIDLDRQNNVPIYDEDGNVTERIHVPSFFATYCDATHVICVSASRDHDLPSSYTNYGRSAIDVAAPGGDVDEWVYALCPQTSLVFNCAGGYYTLGVAGTSQATPHVSGLAALMVERYGRKPNQIKNAIRNSADDLGQRGMDPYFGKGRINVASAVGVN